MDVFALLFIISFLALLVTLAAMHIRKRIKTKDNMAKGGKQIKCADYAPDIQVMWKETLPKHSTRIKLRNSRKLRNKWKGHSKTVRGKKK